MILDNPRTKNTLIYVILGLSAVFIPLVIVKLGTTIGLVLVALIIGVPVGLFMLTNIKFGFYVIMVVSFIITYINRLTDHAVPILVVDILMYVVTAGMLIKQIRTRTLDSTDWDEIKSPIAIWLIIWTVYIHLQIANPSSPYLIGKITAIRFSWYNLLGFFLALNVFDSFKEIKMFFKVLLGVSFLAALYGLSQSYIGLLPYEYNWLFSEPDRVNSWYIGGRLRVWAFLNDPAVFGVLMAFCSLICFILMLHPYKLGRRILLGSSGVLMALAAVSSGTRTAFAMIIFGFVIFAILTINSFRTILFSGVVFCVCVIIYFGPFYSAPIIRIRSAFEGTKDPSMNVRAENKKRIQPYIYSHPIGGSPGTTGEVGKLLSPGHPLAGFPPDSEYLQMALEVGFIGLIIVLGLHFTVASTAITQMFASRDDEIKIFHTAIIVSFVALCFSNLTQLGTTMKPFDFFTFAYYAMVIKIRKFAKIE